MTVAFLATVITEVVAVATLLAFLFLAEVFLLAAFLALGLVFGHLHHNATRVVVRVCEAVENHGRMWSFLPMPK